MYRKMVVELTENEKEILKGIDALVLAQYHFNVGGEGEFGEFANGFDKETPYSLTYAAIKRAMSQFLFYSTEVYRDEVLDELVANWYDLCIDNGESATYNLTANPDHIWK
jgi:hypothetical protein